MNECNIINNPVIIIPAYCPDERLLNLIIKIRKKVKFPIFIVDDGSGIKYQKIFTLAKEVPNCFVYQYKINKGKGLALKEGLKYALNKYPNNCGYITCDADGQHSVEDIISVSNSLMENKKSLILGVRDFSSKDVPIKSRIGNYISSFMFYLITGVGCKDTQTGLRGIQREYENIFLSELGSRYEFEMNFLISMAKKKVKLKEVIIKTIYIDNNEGSHFKPIKDSLRIFSGLLKYTGASIISAVIDISIFTILYITIFKGYELGLLYSTILARLCSGTVNFLLNQRWVFNGSKENKELIKYAFLFITQMLISGVLVSLLTYIISNATLTKLLVDCILFFISYFIQKHIVFSQSNKE
ncbi:GtrA family protein [Clostridium nigeriense]|uniref:GtrA family protein n=1 Tax=Clostridium nigeriense TaxID=1805470 RepID=UPI003D34102D